MSTRMIRRGVASALLLCAAPEVTSALWNDDVVGLLCDAAVT